MNRPNLTLFIVVIILLIGALYSACEKPNNDNLDQKLLNCSVEYLNYVDNFLFDNQEFEYQPGGLLETKIAFEYSGTTFSKKIGGFMQVPNGTNLTNLVFDEDLAYDSIVIQNNKYMVYSKPDLYYVYNDNPDNPIAYELDATNLIKRVITRNGKAFDYIKSGNNILEMNADQEINRTFLFENDNLMSIETNRYENDTLVFKKEILFSQYDDKPNPLKNKFFILGAFYRAFSKNNYTKYTVNEYKYIDEEFVKIFEYSFSMPFAYTSDGLPLFGDYQ